ncbi:MAG: hypothetical protein ABJL59_09405, partial [Anderseniella sp.]
AHAGSLRLRSAGAHFVRRPVGLASALTCFGGVHHYAGSGSENGPPKADKLFDQYHASTPTPIGHVTPVPASPQ